MNVETTTNAIKDALTTHFSTCRKILAKQEEGIDRLGDDDLQLFMSIAYRHLKIHPNHNVTVYQRIRKPTSKEIRDNS